MSFHNYNCNITNQINGAQIIGVSADQDLSAVAKEIEKFSDVIRHDNSITHEQLLSVFSALNDIRCEIQSNSPSKIIIDRSILALGRFASASKLISKIKSILDAMS
uniref:Uncharacterized protein n=1 Tax=Candidatus Kentrum sp. MB TaxID=2138164 RepID=A0A450XG53_9GAMM|nr:MAG: hypothetical protein BECKMB1821G_GA0114241_103526 [Candidatus Kentron sp. MB]